MLQDYSCRAKRLRKTHAMTKYTHQKKKNLQDPLEVRAPVFFFFLFPVSCSVNIKHDLKYNMGLVNTVISRGKPFSGCNNKLVFYLDSPLQLHHHILFVQCTVVMQHDKS